MLGNAEKILIFSFSALRDCAFERAAHLQLAGNLDIIAACARFELMSDRQRTISKEVSLAGPGLFSGETATLTFAPAEADAGITFVREQGDKVATIPALVENVLKRPRRTCLR